MFCSPSALLTRTLMVGRNVDTGKWRPAVLVLAAVWNLGCLEPRSSLASIRRRVPTRLELQWNLGTGGGFRFQSGFTQVPQGVDLETARAAELLPAELWPVKLLCPQSPAPDAEAILASDRLLATGSYSGPFSTARPAGYRFGATLTTGWAELFGSPKIWEQPPAC
jgi:hypothetical protein